MPLNFNMNPVELLNKYSQFQQFLKQSKQNPKELLEQEMKRRNMNPQELQNMVQTAKLLQNILGVK